MMYIPLLPFTFYLSQWREGLRSSLLVVTIITTLAMGLRCLPTLLYSPSDPRLHDTSIPALYISHIINAACAPTVMASVTSLTSTWFGEQERGKATSCAVLSNTLGYLAAYFLGPSLVTIPSDMYKLLVCHTILTAFTMVIALLFFQVSPPTPPSRSEDIKMKRSSSKRRSNREDHQVDGQAMMLSYTSSISISESLRELTVNLKTCILNPNFGILSIMGGIVAGKYIHSIENVGPILCFLCHLLVQYYSHLSV